MARCGTPSNRSASLARGLDALDSRETIFARQDFRVNRARQNHVFSEFQRAAPSSDGDGPLAGSAARSGAARHSISNSEVSRVRI